MKALYGIYGTGGCGRGVLPLVRQQLAQQSVPKDCLVFIDDAMQVDQVNGHKVLTFEEFVNAPADIRFVSVAIANSKVREKIVRRCESAGCRFWSVKADNIIIMDGVEVGEGAILSPFVTLTSNICIGKHFHANLYSYVEHDCVIGDFVTFAPGVKCNGNIMIEDHAYIGSGAVIKQGTPERPLVIGKGAIVGMGAVVTKDVPAGAVVVGNPAKPLIKR